MTTIAVEPAKPPTPFTFKVKRGRYSRTYELVEVRQVTPDTAQIIGRPVYKGGTKGRPHVVGHMVVDRAA